MFTSYLYRSLFDRTSLQKHVWYFARLDLLFIIENTPHCLFRELELESDVVIYVGVL